MNRKQFTFYRSFMDGIKRIKAKSARCEAYDVIIAYALDGVEPELDKLSDAAALAFIMAKPNLDASRKKAEAGQKGGESKPKANASKPQANGKQEKEQEKEQDKEQMLKENTKEKRTAFKAPTEQEVAEYCRERKNGVDPHRFIAHYEAVGWKVGKNPMKDWRAAVRTWEIREKEVKGKTTYSGTQNAADVKAAYQRLLEEETA